MYSVAARFDPFPTTHTHTHARTHTRTHARARGGDSNPSTTRHRGWSGQFWANYTRVFLIYYYFIIIIIIIIIIIVIMF